MSASTSLNTTDTTTAQFLAPETHPRAIADEFLFGAILAEALTRPGLLSEAYRAFHNYSIGNQVLAAMQLSERGLPLAPIASFNGWKDKGRFVRKGQRAIKLFMPVSVKRRDKAVGEDGAETESADGSTFSVFMLRPNWFSLDQTEGAPVAPELTTPEWDASVAMRALDIIETPFADLRGNVQGYASGRTIAINPLNPLKHKTRFHEIAHVVLGHTGEAAMSDGEELSRSIEEVEAESVAYILCSLLELPGRAESRAYIQGWLGCAALPEKSAKRIFGAADRIMKAGQSVDGQAAT